MKKLIITAFVFFVAGLLLGTQLEKIGEDFRYGTKRVLFKGPHGFTMAGKLYHPRFRLRRKYPGILFCHGTLPKGKDTKLYKHLLPKLAKKGYIVFTFDVRGFGASGKVANFRTYDLDFIADTRAALEYMMEKFPVDKENITIAGHSLGGNLSFAVGATSPEVRNIVSIAPGNYAFPEKYSEKRKMSYVRKLEAAVRQKVPVKHWDRIVRPLNLFQYLPIEGKKNVYLILADGDRPDVIRYSEKLFNELKTEKGFVIIPHSNHNFGAEYYKGNEMLDLRPVRVLAREIDTLLSSDRDNGG